MNVMKNWREDVPALRRCPFCGGEAMMERMKISTWLYYAHCASPTCNAKKFNSFRTIEEAVRDWNTREGWLQWLRRRFWL